MRQHTVDGVQLDCAFCQLLLRLAKNVAPNRTEDGNYKSPNHENEKVGQVSAGNFERVVGLRKEVVEAQRGQYDRHYGGSVARVPGGDGDGEDRHFHAAELIILESEGQAERDCDGNNSQAVARDPRLETVKSSIPVRQKAPDTGISRSSREVSHLYNATIDVVTEITGFLPGRRRKLAKRHHGIVNVFFRKPKDRNKVDVIATARGARVQGCGPLFQRLVALTGEARDFRFLGGRRCQTTTKYCFGWSATVLRVATYWRADLLIRFAAHF
jgi:hypothetical protein